MSKNKEYLPPTFYHHKPIKRFYLDGVIHDDSMIGRLKIEYIRNLKQLMLTGVIKIILSMLINLYQQSG